MPSFDDPLHDFRDRAFRRLLENPGNLRHLLADLLPDLIDRFDFQRLEILPRTFLLDDWRRREADVLFRLPFRDDPLAPPALVCVLVEHQSEADPAMPLRILLYAALHWQEEWKAWEAAHPRGDPLRLNGIIPVVFHTGTERWRTYRTMADLVAGPEGVRAFAPEWQPLFWDLAERTPEELLQAAGEWLAALAVVRAERADEEAFRVVFAAALRRLEALSETERVRWHDLLWFVLSWALRRRPGREREALMQTARESQTKVAHREEIRRMSDTIEQTWEQELLERGRALGEARGVVQGQLREARSALQTLLETRFGPLPEGVAQQIQAIEDLERLRRLFRQGLEVASLAEIDL